MSTVRFNLRDKNTKGKTLVVLLYSFDSKRIRISTGISCYVKNWNFNKQRIYERFDIPCYREHNQHFTTLESNIYALQNELNVANTKVSEFLFKELLLQRLDNGNKPKNLLSFWMYFDQFIEAKKREIKDVGDYDKTLRKHLKIVEDQQGIELALTNLERKSDFLAAFDRYLGYDAKNRKGEQGQWYQPQLAGFDNAEEIGEGTVDSDINVAQWLFLTSFSEFGGAEGNGQPLPVELVSFTGACEEGVINLTWQTASEFNSEHFDVEKSRDGENWLLLTTMPAAGTSNELITYQYGDDQATDGNNYFRLRQVDIDGTEKLYDPINVSCKEVTTGYFTSYPNPSGNSFQIIVNNKELLGNCVMNIVDASGKVIEQLNIEVKEGINLFMINQTLNPGIYFLNITNGDKSTPVVRHAVN